MAQQNLQFNFNIITNSILYYKLKGYQYINCPWTVPSSICDITIPNTKSKFIIKDDETLVGSSEQSFLQLIKTNELQKGMYVSMTPCFRDDIVDEIHNLYFYKTELFIYDDLEQLKKKFFDVLNTCVEFFSKYTKVIIKEQTNIISPDIDILPYCYDIIDENTCIELGSYGIRHYTLNNHEITWIYGTGCAEPRLSYVINKQNKIGYHNNIIPKNQIGTFEKITEEFEELIDAHLSNNKIMELIEISDLIGSIELYLNQHFKYITIDDIIKMKDVTKRAFINGKRN